MEAALHIIWQTKNNLSVSGLDFSLVILQVCNNVVKTFVLIAL